MFKVNNKDTGFLSFCWVTGGHAIYPPTEGILTLTGIEPKPTPFQNSASKVAELQVHAISYPQLRLKFIWAIITMPI